MLAKCLWRDEGTYIEGNEMVDVSSPKYVIFDAHLHGVNFIQQTDGFKALLREMDKARVEQCVVFGLPVSKQWPEWENEEPTYYLSDESRCYYYSLTDATIAQAYMDLTADNRKRIIPLLCGFSPVDRYAIKHVERIINLYPGVFKGIGEILCRHDDLSNLTYGQPARINHKALFPIFNFAAQHQLPVLVHQNATSVGRQNQLSYTDEMIEMLERFPNTTLVWAHCGVSRRVRIENLHEVIDHLLGKHNNLYVDYSWLVFDNYICPNGQPSENWLEVTEKHSDRICLGSDIFGHFESLSKCLERYTPFLDCLSKETRDRVCTKTAERLYASVSAV
jgi:hypothetical protein